MLIVQVERMEFMKEDVKHSPNVSMKQQKLSTAKTKPDLILTQMNVISEYTFYDLVLSLTHKI